MTRLLRRIAAFLVRDFKAETSYKLAFAMQLAGLAWMIALLWFASRLVGDNVPALARYGGSFFSFVLLGIAPLEYLRVGVMGFSSTIREAQSHGTLEALLVTRVGIPTIVFGSVAYDYARATIRAGLLLLVALWTTGTIGHVDVPALLVFFALSILCFGALGILSASFVMIFKKGDPVSLVVLMTSTLFAGVWFPPAILGKWQAISKILPLTYALEGVRMAVLQGHGLGQLWPEASILALFCAVLVPLAAWAFRAAVDRARRDGTLSHY
jgi:ABC-2 type transport system permease protein